MSEQRMDIFLLATPQAGIEHAVLVSNLSAAFKKDAAAIEKMLSRPRTMVKGDVTPEIADKYKVLIEKSGGQCELVVREQAIVGTQGEETAAAAPSQGEALAVQNPEASLASAAIQANVDGQASAIGQESSAGQENSAGQESTAGQESAAGQFTQAAATPPSSPQAETSVSEPVKVQAMTLEPMAQVNPETGEAQPFDSAQGDDQGEAACYCTKCGTVIRVGQSRCPKCFTPVTEYTYKSKTTASLLALFIGGSGLHRLYLGQWWGIIYLIFWCTLIPSLISLVEAILFWLTPQKKWDAKYGQVQRSSPLLAAVFVVGFIVLIAIVGILAAVAVPAYQDYSNRAKIAGSMPLVQESLNKVASFIKTHQTYPSDNQSVGLPEKISGEFVEAINLQDGAIVQVVYQLSGVKENNIILWIPTENKGEIIWDCKRGTLPDRYRPKHCRSGDNPINRELEKVAAESALSQKLYSADKHVSLLVPITWEAKELLPSAILGAARLLDENYVVVLADAKVNFEENLTLADYSRNVQLQLAENIKNGMVQGDVEYLTVGGFPAEQFVFPGVVGGVKISYVVTLINADTHFYRVLAWTLQTNMDSNKKLLKTISESVKIY